jgi:hypothetical protein
MTRKSKVKLEILVSGKEQVEALKGIEERLRKIEALASNPHWHNDRRYTIEVLARESQDLLGVFVKEVPSEEG